MRFDVRVNRPGGFNMTKTMIINIIIFLNVLIVSTTGCDGGKAFDVTDHAYNLMPGGVGSWTTTNSISLLYGLAYNTSVVYDDYIYVLGGANNSNPYHYNVIRYAKINTDGTIGAWSSTTSFATSRSGHTSIVYNGYIFIMGGSNITIPQYYNDVQYAKVNLDGTIDSGSWPSTTPFPIAREEHTSVVYNDYIYIIGGTNGSTYYNDVQYAKVNLDGTIDPGAWNSTTSFPNLRAGHTSVIFNGYVYIIGGTNGSTYYNDVQFAKINSDGSFGSWIPTTSLPNARSGHTSVVNNGYVYVIGGNGSTYYNDVQCAKINSDGTVGAWRSTTALPFKRSDHTSVAHNGYLYLIGGRDTSSNDNSVLYSQINK
jgi:N-acetylneuraminic acid mutarotase